MKKRKWVTGGLLALSLIVVFFVVFYLAGPNRGHLPAMPDVRVDEKEMAQAVARLHQRAGTVEMTEYHQQLLSAFVELNLAEAQPIDAQQISRLRQKFVEATAIGATAKKERYVLFGDYLAVQFEDAFTRVIDDIKAKGMKQALHSNSQPYRRLVELGGNFFTDCLRIGLVAPDGTVRMASYIPQILFRKRWRILGEIPFQYHFLKVESLVDAAYLLKNGNPKDLSARLKAVQRIHRLLPEFRHDIATGLVYFQAKETARARRYVKHAVSQRPDDFEMNQFLLFLTNDTKS